MFLNNYTYKVGTFNGRFFEIENIDRNKYLSTTLGKYLTEWMNTLDLVGTKIAVLYSAGPAIHHSDSRKIPHTGKDGVIVIKSQLGNSIYEILRDCKFNIDFVSINANTCASTMYGIYEASKLLKDEFTDVLVLSMDLVDDTQELLFRQIGINITCGDGLVGLHFSNKKSEIEIEKVSWKWNRDSSPMTVSCEGYRKVIEELGTADIVKVHGSGTERNTQEEYKALTEVLGDIETIEYKSKIGHTQGVSAGIEMCLLTVEKWTTALVLASGLGGFYGGCKLRRTYGDTSY